MKMIIAALFLLPHAAFAGKMNELSLMATESIEDQLNLLDANIYYELTHQEFAAPLPGMDLAIRTSLSVRNVRSGETQEWTCNTQFVKTPGFFKIFKTVCN